MVAAMKLGICRPDADQKKDPQKTGCKQMTLEMSPADPDKLREAWLKMGQGGLC